MVVYSICIYLPSLCAGLLSMTTICCAVCGPMVGGSFIYYVHMCIHTYIWVKNTSLGYYANQMKRPESVYISCMGDRHPIEMATSEELPVIQILKIEPQTAVSL